MNVLTGSTRPILGTVQALATIVLPNRLVIVRLQLASSSARDFRQSRHRTIAFQKDQLLRARSVLTFR